MPEGKTPYDCAGMTVVHRGLNKQNKTMEVR